MALFDNPYAGPYLMTTGLGLLQAAQPQPHGVNRYSYIADAVQRAGQNMMAQKDQEQRQRLFEAQMQQMARAQQERDIQNVGRQTLMDLLERAEGGTVPTGRMMGGEPETITWQPSLLDEGTKTSLMAQAGGDDYWKALVSSQFEKPVTAQYTYGNYFVPGMRNPVAARKSSNVDAPIQIYGRGGWENAPAGGSFISQQAAGEPGAFAAPYAPPTVGGEPTVGDGSKVGTDVDPALAYGLPAAAGMFSNRLVGYLTGKTPFPGVLKAEQELKQLHNFTTLTLNGLSDRDTNQTRALIMELMPSVPFTTDDQARTSYEGIVRHLDSEIGKKTRIAMGEGAYLPKAISDARQDLDGLVQLRKAYSDLLSRWNRTSTPAAPGVPGLSIEEIR